MPKEELDQDTGAILFKPTEEEKAIRRIERKVDNLTELVKELLTEVRNK